MKTNTNNMWIFFSLITLLGNTLCLGSLNTNNVVNNNSTKINNIFIVAGGYNAANNGELSHNVELNTFPHVMIWNNSSAEWLTATYPLYGADGNRGSIWGWFGEDLYNMTNNVVYIIDIARSNSSLYDWKNGGKYNNLLFNTINLGLSMSKNITVLWQEGEKDANGGIYSSIINYDYYLSELVSNTAPSVSWGISVSAYSPINYASREQYIRDNQRSVISQFFNKTFSGPNSDVLCTQYRYNDYYFNIEGLQKLGKYWAESVNNRSRDSHLKGSICLRRIINWNNIFLHVILVICIIICAFIISVSVSRGLSRPWPQFYYRRARNCTVNTYNPPNNPPNNPPSSINEKTNLLNQQYESAYPPVYSEQKTIAENVE